MNIEQLLGEASWRLRAFWGSNHCDPERVGWRVDTNLCPIAEWLDAEIGQRGTLPSVMEEIVYCGQVATTPPVLLCFVDLIDGACCASDRWLAANARVGREEALAALAEAERRAAQALLPEQTKSCHRCAYSAPHGWRCRAAATSRPLYGFLSLHAEPEPKPERIDCWPFAGRLCERHQKHLVIPLKSWWPSDAQRQGQGRTLVLAK